VVIKYDLDGNEVGRCGISINISTAQYPLFFGNANIAVYENTLGCMFDTKWIDTHQGSEFAEIDKNSMVLKNFSKWEGSHSFGVSLIPTEYGFASVQRGDASPRGINFNSYIMSDEYYPFADRVLCRNLFHASGQYGSNADHHDGNNTYLYIGGLAKSNTTYALAGESEKIYSSMDYFGYSDLHTEIYDVFLKISDQTFNNYQGLAGIDRIDNETGEVADKNVIWLTECNENEQAGVSKVVTLEDGSYCVLWNKYVNGSFDSVRYVITDECGNILRQESEIKNARLSGSSIQPVVFGTTLKWAMTDMDNLYFYTVDLYGDTTITSPPDTTTTTSTTMTTTTTTTTTTTETTAKSSTTETTTTSTSPDITKDTTTITTGIVVVGATEGTYTVTEINKTYELSINNADNVTAESSDEDVAAVRVEDGKLYVTPTAFGSVEITLTDNDTKEEYTFTFTIKENVDDFLLGDADGDGTISAMDASAALTYYVMNPATIEELGFPFDIKAADWDENGIIDARDASAILTYYVSH